MSAFKYTWKHGIQHTSSTELKTNKPLKENIILVDLFNGDKYSVLKIYAAKPNDRAWNMMPDTVAHTWFAGTLPEDELKALRERAGYVPDSFCRPFGDVVFV
jgi:hypothetical protein